VKYRKWGHGKNYSPNIDGFSANIYEIVFIYGFTLILRSF